jgi:hypothetical protein
MRVLAYCAEQDVFSARHLKTVEKFGAAFEAQRGSETTTETTLPALGYDTTLPASFSEPTYSVPLNQGQMAASAAFNAQPYSDTTTQGDPVPPIPQYSYPFQGMPSVGRSDSQSTSYSNVYDSMATGSSEGQTADFTMDNNVTVCPRPNKSFDDEVDDFFCNSVLAWWNALE